MSKLLINLLYGSVCLLLLIICSAAIATDVYVETDQHGRTHFTDRKPDSPHELKRIEIENTYPWAEAPAYSYSKKPKRKKKRSKKQKHFSLTELKNKCHAARGKYNSYRASARNIDWDTYRAKLERYKAKRDEWCSRLLRGK
jgi:hypothetical protein